MVDQSAEIKRLREALQAASMNFLLVSSVFKEQGYQEVAATLERYSKEAADAISIPEQGQ